MTTESMSVARPLEPAPALAAKRTLDVLLSGAGLMASLPLWAVIAALVKLEDGGPVFFGQERVGKGGRVFRVLKFRSMIPNAEAKVGALQASHGDPRITRIGRWLRATAMDELPQLLSIFRGDMSFVGPRALRPGEIEVRGDGRDEALEDVPGFEARCRVQPGLTGVAQIYAPRDIPRRQKFRYDRIYIRRQSFWLDMRLIALSFWITFRGTWESRGKRFLMPGTLVVNPHLDLKPVRDDGQVVGVKVIAPVKGADLHQTTITRSVEPAIFGALLLHSATSGAGGVEGFAAQARPRLADMGVLVSPERVSTPVWFSCDLDAGMTMAAGAAAPLPDDVMVNPTLRQFGPSGFPDEMRGRVRLTNRFRTDRSWLMLQTPDLSAPAVFSYSAAASVVDRLAPGKSVPRDIDPGLADRLVAAGVLVSASKWRRALDERTRHLAEARDALRDCRYTTLPRVIAPLQLAAIRRYYRELIAEGFVLRGDAEWPDRHFAGRDPVGYFFHHQMNGLVSEVAGETLKPSFSFFASYRTGSVLPPHRDRDQCEYALSIQLDYSPEPSGETPWPLFVQPPGQPVAIPLTTAAGGAVLYYGKEVRHHREPLTDGDYSRHWFSFYVPEAFSGPLD